MSCDLEEIGQYEYWCSTHEVSFNYCVDVETPRCPYDTDTFLSEDSPNTPEPPPQPSDHPAAWDLVKADIDERDKVGEARYGVRLHPFDGRRTEVDAYQEALDLTVYLRKLVYEVGVLRKENADLKSSVASLETQLQYADNLDEDPRIALGMNEASIDIKGNKHYIRFKGQGHEIIASALYDFVCDAGGDNYVECRFGGELGDMVVTLQKPDGKTPDQLKREALDEVERLKEENADLRRTLCDDVV